MARKDQKRSRNMKDYWEQVRAGTIKRRGYKVKAAAAADDLPPPAAVAAAVADAAPAAAARAPARANRSNLRKALANKRRGPRREPHVPNVDRDGQLYILNRFAKRLVSWRKKNPGVGPSGYEAKLRKKYGAATAKKIMQVLHQQGAARTTKYHSKNGEKYIQRRSPYPATLAAYSLRQIMSLARKLARRKNQGLKTDSTDLIGRSGKDAEAHREIASAIRSCVKKYKSGKREGKWYASRAAAKRICKGQDYMPIRMRGPNGETLTLKLLARGVCKGINTVANGAPISAEQMNAAIRGVAKTYEVSDAYLKDYCDDAIFWDPSYRRYRVDTPLVGYGEGDMISVHDRIGGSIRGYGHRRRRRRCCCKKRSSCRGGSIRGYGHRRRRRRHSKKRSRICGGSIVGKGIFGLARKANKFARKTKILSKGARLLGYGMDSAGFLDKAW